MIQLKFTRSFEALEHPIITKERVAKTSFRGRFFEGALLSPPPSCYKPHKVKLLQIVSLSQRAVAERDH